MPSGFLYGKTQGPASTGSFVQLRSTAIPSNTQIVSLKIYLIAGQNAVVQIDSDATGANTTLQSTFETGIPGTGQWIDVGPTDPSRVWIRSASTTPLTTVYWIVCWL
jgi:hypothetical protein